MNKIKINRMLLAGLVTFIVWVVVELLVEGVIGRILFGNSLEGQWLQHSNIAHWHAANHVFNILIALLNCTILIWLYASLRPMFGVGTKTALIASAFGIVFVFSMTLNGINMGLFPPKIGLIEWGFELIEFPFAMLAGAWVYEGAGNTLAIQNG